jgi:hypothetical protein
MIRSILAVIAGLIVLTIVSFAVEFAADPLLMHIFPRTFPNAAALSANVSARLFMTAYTLLAIAIGGYATAWIARRAPIAHAAAMGAIEVALTLYVMIAAPFREAHQGPLWGWILGMVLMVPAACLGAAVRTRRTGQPVATTAVAP